MKKISLVSSTFNQVLNNSIENHRSMIKAFVAFFKTTLVVIVMMSFYSCDRNVSSGCGSWPMANSNNHNAYKGSGKITPKANSKHLNTREYAYYKNH
ncbi:MAG: hypothetical protein RJA25_1431 [Bacteroidota bacterium]|jgi:hypothetical protein